MTTSIGLLVSCSLLLVSSSHRIHTCCRLLHSYLLYFLGYLSMVYNCVYLDGPMVMEMYDTFPHQAAFNAWIAAMRDLKDKAHVVSRLFHSTELPREAMMEWMRQVKQVDVLYHGVMAPSVKSAYESYQEALDLPVGY